ncbi:hypothetical protein AK830_g5528 [Neonectria ditissima]|uniref:Zn(2)-C6 fungal-type domain-containing protein n=1 Tax=Neonectria ditissima TaxID=78410 RepID=A0A0P7B3T3_9HYPO|nr:hypothetical protein AK830_g5528 [Neonectria ditissima]
MASTDTTAHNRPIAIAPAPTAGSTELLDANGDSPQSTMPYTCQTCAKRKVKCDKVIPVCFSCRKGKLDCLYQAPRRRKRKLGGDVDERLSRMEPPQHQSGSEPQKNDESPLIQELLREPISLRWDEPNPTRTGKLLTGEGKSRYIDSPFWRNLGEDGMQHISDDEEEDREAANIAGASISDPLTAAFMGSGSQQSLLQYHPSHEEAIVLWKVHMENVEPLCKILHLPSISNMITAASQTPATASKSDECLLFSIYHFAVFSMAEEECVKRLGRSRNILLQRYHFATRQALVNASFLKTTEMSVLQALVLFLIPCRYSYDSHTYWILTGVAVRIGQRIGLHRDGEKLGLPPFEVQMRRRLYYQLLPLDGIASQMSGTGMVMMPDTWDTRPPLNLNDDQIWPGMTETPEEHKGATDMIFCLTRACIGKFFADAGKSMHSAGSGQFRDYTEADLAISKAESEVEERFIRYCDIVNPLHFLTMASARCGITAMRLRVRMPKIRNQTATDTERKDLFHLAEKILDTDAAAYAHASLKRYQWHVRPFFLWGTWDSLILVIASLWRVGLLSSAETDAAWARAEQVYGNHAELLESKRALYVAFGRLTLKAWAANPPSTRVPEPAFITALRSRRKARCDSSTATLSAETDAPLDGPSQENDETGHFGEFSDGLGFDINSDFDLDSAAWMFWDQLIQDDRALGS